MERKKFLSDVRQFKKFQHECVSELDVEDELICFVYSPRSATRAVVGDPVNISIDLMSSPNVTRVYYGEKEETYEKMFLPEIIAVLLQRLFPFACFVLLPLHHVFFLIHCER